MEMAMRPAYKPRARRHRALDSITTIDYWRICLSKQLMHVGSFRGKPIVARQRNTFVDDNGVPIPLLPYNYDSWRIHTRPLY
ncbi:hypothetical protein TELCIR_11571 [Teladorsagia circumcincta]|uniref:Uncharacterized protein n=1 Tax=Teladorsagia circumcincta TaxID=45464 RepID=A0A2G9U8W5_TELCI|nr:hypothetical protein TELCIR_11571 [Teladorsagia circumcincta]